MIHLSNIRSRTSGRIYRLTLPLLSPETLSSSSKSRIFLYNAHLPLFVRMDDTIASLVPRPFYARTARFHLVYSVCVHAEFFHFHGIFYSSVYFLYISGVYYVMNIGWSQSNLRIVAIEDYFQVRIYYNENRPRDFRFQNGQFLFPTFY